MDGNINCHRRHNFLLLLFIPLMATVDAFHQPSQIAQTHHALSIQPRCSAKKNWFLDRKNAIRLDAKNNEMKDDQILEPKDIAKFRLLMGNLYLGAGIAHAADCVIGPSALIVSAGSPPFELLPVEGKALVALWCLAGPITFWLTRLCVNKKGGDDGEDSSIITSSLDVADIGLVVYGAIEIFGSYFLPDRSPFWNAIAVQLIVLAAWLYSNRSTGESSV